MTDQWLTVDEGRGRAVDFATLLEPGAFREYVTMHQHLDVRHGDELLKVACGTGLALELAQVRGVTDSGIDAAARLVAIARDRVPMPMSGGMGPCHRRLGPPGRHPVQNGLRGRCRVAGGGRLRPAPDPAVDPLRHPADRLLHRQWNAWSAARAGVLRAGAPSVREAWEAVFAF